MKQAITLYQKIKQHSLRLLCLMLLTQAFVFNGFAQTQLELANGSYPSAPNGLTLSNQTASLLQNTSGSTFTTFNPTITVTASISNQQYNAIATSRVSTGKGMSFGGRVNSYGTTATQMPVYNSLNTVDNPVNTQYTSNPNGPSSTGIYVADNYGFYFYNSVDELFTTNAATNGRYYFGDITLTFSQPVSNPVIHINGLGCNVLFGITDKQGITSELELQTSGVTLSKLSGSSELNVTANKILNNAVTPNFNCGSGAACGSVKCAGTNITTLTFKVYVRGDGNGSNWSHTSINAGDEFMLSASINRPDTLSGNVFNDMNGLTDNTVNGTGTNLSGALYINLVDGNNKVVASVAVASTGSYTFPNIGDGNYTLVLSTTQGTQGNAAPAASLPTGWVNTGENIGTSAGNDGSPNGVLPVTMNGANVSNANFGIVYCSNILPTTITANGATTACLGAGLTLTSTSAISYQWYRDTTPIAGANSQSYIPTVSGTYTTHIITGGGVCNISSNAITVTINYAPNIGITPSDTANICVANNDKICPATWGSSNYQWYKNGVAMAAPQGTSSCLYPTSAGNYSLAVQTGAGCWSLPSASVYVKIDTICTHVVTGGGTGGVESKTLGDVIAQRIYGNAINSKTEVDGIRDGIAFVKSGVIVNGLSNLNLSTLIPNKLEGIDRVWVSSPKDLTTITNATEVFAVDFVKSNDVRAVVFSTKTLTDVYNHTKPICDRLKGSELLDVKVIKVKGYNIMAYTIRQRTGEVEYAVNLSAGTDASRNTISLQSNWFTDSYAKDEQLYNFQVWAASQNMAMSLVDSIITKLQSIGSINVVTNTDLPKAYITKGNRVNTNLSFTIKNNTSATNGYFELKEKANENSAVTTRRVAFTLAANAVSAMQLPVRDYYETNIYVYLNNTLTDLVYLSDGTWNTSYNKLTTSVSKFNVVNESSVVENKNEYRLLRNVELNANTKDYVTVYKTLLGGGIEKDLSAYTGLLFNTATKGVGKVQITLIKKSVVNWNDQYNYTLDIEGDKEYVVPFARFKSASNNQGINANDVVAVNFSFITSKGTATNMTVDLNNVRFGKVLPIIIDENSKTIVLSPNPNKGSFNISFSSLTNQPLVIKVVELATGREVTRQNISAIKGINKQSISIENYVAQGSYVLMIDGESDKYEPVKLFINK